MARSASSVQAEFTAPTQHMREAPGVWIGRYRLIELIGEGGFGTVWRAEQHDPVRREVALKVVKPGMDSAPILARFAAERQALTRMEHPHIATLLDAGQTGNGRPFFAMTLVHGHPITRYCDDRQLGIRRRLELFTAVCEAVEHAHRRGILHRDLKPSNILVEEIDGAAMPRVIDFGIAKVLGAVDDEASADALTQRGAAIGTPQYMSPEQAASTPDVDTRSDVYALGAVLYEMLTGSPPIEREQIKSRSWEEILRLVREADVPRPSDRLAAPTEDAETRAARRQTTGRRLVDSIRGELDWIVLKALEKDRERRYA
ncbi:MAG: serine/threonine-protein kinase, partial [Verrucomicrobiales bacterium]